MLQAMAKELNLLGSFPSDPEEVQTLYFGGGTPSLLSGEEIQTLLDAVREDFHLAVDAEITLEANPDDISTQRLADWKRAGINRFSIGVQSFIQQDLEWMNRAHDARQALQCIQMVKEAGFDNFSCDLIYGVPGLSDENWKKNVDTMISLGVPHLSCYALTVEPGTALQKMIGLHKKVDVDAEQQARQFSLLMEWLTGAGYEHYEISNFARPGYRSRHNSSYWQGIPYYGIGPSAHSFDGSSRKWNISNNALYIRSLENNIIPSEEEVLSPEQRLNEYIMTSLRTIEGLDLKWVEKKFGPDRRSQLEKECAGVDMNLIKVNEGVIQLTNEGKLWADGIAAKLFI